MYLLSRRTVINIYIPVLVIRVHVKEVFHLPRRCDYVEFVRSLLFLKRERASWWGFWWIGGIGRLMLRVRSIRLEGCPGLRYWAKVTSHALQKRLLWLHTIPDCQTSAEYSGNFILFWSRRRDVRTPSGVFHLWRSKSLGDYLVRAKVDNRRPNNLLLGTVKCSSGRCEVCKYMDENSHFKSSQDERRYSINYNLNCNSSNVVYLITCKKCSLQYVGSTITKFRLRFNNHKSRIRKHELLGRAEREADDLLYRHFCSEGHSGLSDVKIQLIDQVYGEEQLREKEGQWAYRLKTLDPNGLNDNDFFFVQNRAF